MAIERTLSIIKPDAIAKDKIGAIISILEEGGLRVVAAKMLHLTRNQAEKFYAVHEGKPFYESLVNFMISGPVLVQVLEGEDAVFKNREVMGATNPNDADPGTIRYKFADNVEQNAVHGSDSVENAKKEIDFFFKETNIFSRSK